MATPEILKWKKYIKQSKNTNGSPLEPLYGSKKKKVSTIMTFRPINLPFCSGEKSYWCRFEKKEKSHHGASTLVWERSHNGALNCTKMTFLQNTNEPHLLKSTPLWLYSRPEMKHLCDFSLFSQICTNMTFPQNKVKAPLWLFSFFRPKASNAIFRVKKCPNPTADWFRW